ncbi:hypothetical protein [Chitinophaga sp. CF418]|uniref:hypothetical protein n=1 Tax=Chitinophaga sp. CF418 TaxID=1855287 RepID=UPI00091085FD|nr:hypothetical protein [Chitinophaga sp. CF418]SHN45179.1 hypothetical protein SAMN05216311_11939 [Chitinophaga sp. CF418]
MKPAFYMMLTAVLLLAACKHPNTPLQKEFKGLSGRWKFTALYQGYSSDYGLKIWRAVLEDKYIQFNMDGSMTDDRYNHNAFKVVDFYSDGQLDKDSVIFTYRKDSFQSDTIRYSYELSSDELILYPLLTGVGTYALKYVRVTGK